MIRSANYIRPIEKSLEVLEESHVETFPVLFDPIIKRYEGMIKVLTYSAYRKGTRLTQYDVIAFCGSKHGASIRIGQSQFLILYNDEKTDDINRYTIAHELGHIFLLHHDDV